MRVAKPPSIKRWKTLLLTAEAIAVLACLYGISWRVSYHYYSRYQILYASDHISVRALRFAEQWARPAIWSFIAALLTLLLVSPFFLRSSLRRVAVTAWIIGAVAFLCIGFLLYSL